MVMITKKLHACDLHVQKHQNLGVGKSSFDSEDDKTVLERGRRVGSIHTSMNTG